MASIVEGGATRVTPLFLLLLRFLSCDPVYAQLQANDRLYYTVNGSTPGPSSNYATVVAPSPSVSVSVFVGQTAWVKGRIFRPSTGEWGTVDSHLVVVDQALPIELLYFQGQYLPQGGRVMLEWYTLSESQNYGFMLERNGHLLPITIPGHGTTNEPHRYNFLDRFAFEPARVTYRLVQIDLDGTKWISPPIQVQTQPAITDNTP